MSKRQKSSSFTPRGDPTTKTPVSYPGQVKVDYFPKRCPTCGGPLKHIKKMSGQWYECRKCGVVK